MESGRGARTSILLCMGLFSRFFVQALWCSAERTLCRVRLALTERASQRLHLALGPEFAQLELLNLAGSGQRKSFDGEPVPRRLVMGKRGAHVFRQFILVDD